MSDNTATPAGGASEAKLALVGIGASAARLETVERLFSRFQEAPEHATVLIFQHREALDEKRLRAALDSVPGAKTVLVEETTPLRSGTIYVCGTDLITTVRDNQLVVRQAAEPPGERGTIDSFLVSLADERGEDAVGIVLSGTGGDGTLGIAAVKDHGGLAIAEPPHGHPEDHLAESGSAAALADFVLPPEEMPEHIRVYLRHLRRLRDKQDFNEVLAAAEVHLKRIADVLQTRTGHDFHGYKRNTFLRRVHRRMHVVRSADISAYVDFLRNDPAEAQNLFNDLLIGVTQFFRDKKEFEILENEIIPRLFEGKGPSDTVRLWVLGCATGEEAYSLAILLRERMARMEGPPRAQIFATDIDGRALASARVGRYRTTIQADIAPDRLARWFVREGDTYCVVKELREMCIFSQHNVIKDAPFSRLDLVSCRNLLIYLEADLQSRVIPLFHFALLPDRYLFLGNSENVTRHPKLFVPVDRRARIFKKLDSGSRLPPDFPIGAPVNRLPRVPNTAATVLENGLERRAQRIVERYFPAYVITDEHFEVLHFSGRTGRYLEPTAGTATLELLSLVHRDLRVDLRNALSRALELNQPVQTEQIILGVNGSSIAVTISIEPLQERPGDRRNFIVVFKDAPVQTAERRHTGDGAALAHSDHVDHLEGELQAVRSRLQVTIEELESTNEELKSSNEEYQSLNEELQSANEELETSREELQSINEELTTVNGELAHRVHDLTRATSDLKNFIESTQIATIFLDNDLRVMNFTPAMNQVLHLVETDIGRPVSHIKARIPIEPLFEDARLVLRTLAPAERELADPASDRRYMVRTLPYRSIENFIGGVVITFLDITAVTRSEVRQRLLLAELQHRVRNTLGVVRSIARRSAENSISVEDYATHLDGRLAAFARTQALVTRDPGSGVDLEFLVGEELHAYREQEGERLQISGPTIRLQPKAAEMIALAIHELATNAVKYGALSTRTGRIEIGWHITAGDPEVLMFEWDEMGGPPITEPPTRKGFGTELLERTLAYELKTKTELHYDRAGFRCRIALPLLPDVLSPQRT